MTRLWPIGKKQNKAFCNTKIIWFELYLINDNKVAKTYKSYLEKLRVFKPYILDGDKEVLLTKKNQTGSSAFVRFYDQIDSNKSFGEKTYSEVAAVFSNDKNRSNRKKSKSYQ